MVLGCRVLGIVSFVSMVVGLHATQPPINLVQDVFLIDAGRIAVQSEQWQDYFEHQQVKRYATATCSILLVTGLIVWHVLASNDSQGDVAKQQLDVSVQGLTQEQINMLSVNEFMRRRTWGYRLETAFSEGFDKAIMLAIASVCLTSFTGASSWLWNKIKEHLGFADDVRFKALMRDYGLDASRLLYSLNSFFKIDAVEANKGDLQERLAQQKMYGLFIDQRAFVMTIERFLGFVVAAMHRDDIDTEHVDAVQNSLEQFVALTNDILLRQKEMVSNSAEHGLYLGLIQGVCEEGVRLMTTVGTLLYGKEFNVQQEA